ncbi:13505_t:CDS:2, partial [Gigaspora rosea]
KIDMPINRMRDYYKIAKENNSIESEKHMREVAEYCIIDALRCQQLMVKHNDLDNAENKEERSTKIEILIPF